MTIDYLTVVYRNYDLLNLQIENFKKRFVNKDYRLIVVDNTPDNEKIEIQNKDDIDVIVLLESSPNFDGISHGAAIDTGLQYCESDLICLFDTDFFFLDNEVHEYALKRYNEGYMAFGTSWDDGDGTKLIYNKFPQNFDNIPCCFGAFYDLNLAKSETWVITLSEVHQNAEVNGFVEVGWRIRKNILDNKLKTFSWYTDAKQYGECFFKDSHNDDRIMGIHYVGGSHRRWNPDMYERIQKIINEEYNV